MIVGTKRPWQWMTSLAAATALSASPTGGQAQGLAEENVLVVYNSADADSVAVFDAYTSVRPGVVGFDLNTVIDGSALSPGNVSYAQFVTDIRNPIRDFLTPPSGPDLTEQIQVITLTKGIPTRIADLNETLPSNTSIALIGDMPGLAASTFEDQNATFATVDSELTLLFQDLETGEAGGAFDSRADNVIINPFFDSDVSITASDRSTIEAPRTLTPVLATSPGTATIRALDAPTGELAAFDPGAIFLTARLDGKTVDDVVASIGRAQNVVFDLTTDAFVIDEFDPPSGPELDATGISPAVRAIDPGGDFDQLALDLAAAGFERVLFDEGEAFLVGANGTVADPAADDDPGIAGPVAALVTFGGNHSDADQDGFILTFADASTGESQFIDGAVFTSVESFNAREFGGLPQFENQGSLAEFLAAGGTFGVGTAFEPFSLGVNEADLLLARFLSGELTFVEAAFASVPFVSGNTIVLGDPLARATVVPEPGAALLVLAAAFGLRRNRSRTASLIQELGPSSLYDVASSSRDPRYAAGADAPSLTG
ncbi:MAG: hypothetical protein AAGE65_07040 [Planctomycetota bacterium]